MATIVLAPSYGRSMSEGKPSGKLERSIQKALRRYHEQRAAGDDMAEAGKELASAVENAILPRPCAVPRDMLLADDALRDYGYTEAVIPLDEIEDLDQS